MKGISANAPITGSKIGPRDLLADQEIPAGVLVQEMSEAPLFRGTDALENKLPPLQQAPRVFILDMKRVLAMEPTGLKMLKEFHLQLNERGIPLLLAGPHTQPLLMMQRDDFVSRLGIENVCENLEMALHRAREITAQARPG